MLQVIVPQLRKVLETERSYYKRQEEIILNNFIRKSIGLVLALAMVLGMILIPTPAHLHANAAQQLNTLSDAATRNAATDVQNGVTLHA